MKIKSNCTLFKLSHLALFTSLVFHLATPLSATVLSTQERFEKIKGYIEKYDDFTNNTIFSELVEDFYKPDRDFVLEQIEKRNVDDNIKKKMRHAIKYLDGYLSFQIDDDEGLSLTTLNVIGLLWARILSGTSEPGVLEYLAFLKPSPFFESPDPLTLSGKSFTSISREEIEKDIKEILGNGIYYSLARVGPRELLLVPAVSADGDVSPDIMNDVIAFKVNGKLYSINFIAVATNEKINFDFFRDLSPYELWWHDIVHYLYFAAKKENRNKYAKKLERTFAFKKAAKVNEDPQLKLAFFYMFRENFFESIYTKNDLLVFSKQKMENIQKMINDNSLKLISLDDAYKKVLGEESLKMTLLEKTKTLFSKYKVSFSSFNDTKEQFEAYINLCRYFGIKIIGNSLEEEAIEYLENLHDGIEKLLKFADDFKATGDE